jgi:hypothetical protein
MEGNPIAREGRNRITPTALHRGEDLAVCRMAVDGNQ